MKCDAEWTHTPCPGGYVARAEWAEKKMRTHRCIRCPRCGLWAIWKPKPKRKPAGRGGKR